MKVRLSALGLALPEVAAPVGPSGPAVRDGSVVYSAGQLPLVDGQSARHGPRRSGTGFVSQDAAAGMTRTTALNASAAIGTVVDLDRVRRVVKVVGYISGTPDFYGQSAVLNGASELLAAVCGAAGKHPRSAVDAVALPRNAPVEVEVIASLREPSIPVGGAHPARAVVSPSPPGVRSPATACSEAVTAGLVGADGIPLSRGAIAMPDQGVPGDATGRCRPPESEASNRHPAQRRPDTHTVNTTVQWNIDRYRCWS